MARIVENAATDAGIGMRFVPPFGHEEIKSILPHRPPFLLVDYIEEIEPDKRIVGYKYFTSGEPIFQGDFTFVPPAIITEVMAQVGAILVLNKSENSGKFIYFMGIERIRFRKAVPPGSLLKVEADVVRIRRRIGIFRGKAFLGDKMVADGVMMFAL
ncbi:3-hydroxyacyl-ACP dehydratase FabZ [Acidobacteriota bacterium]